MGFESTWKTAKKNFETTTGKRKPGAKFLGVFHKAGVEDAAKTMDGALAKDDPKVMEKALGDLSKAAGAYRQVLEKAAKDDPDGSNYSAELKKLGTALDNIVRDATTEKGARTDELQGQAVDAQKTAAEKLLGDINRALTLVQAEMKTLAGTCQAGDAALRVMIELQPQGKIKEAKATGSQVVAASKDAAQSSKRVAGISEKATKMYHAALTEAKKGGPVNRKVGGVFDRISGSTTKMEELRDQAAERAAEMAALVEDAKQAITGSLDTRKVMAKSTQKLADQALKDAQQFDASVREIEGTADRADHQVLLAGEAEDAAGRAEAIKVARWEIGTAREKIGAIRKELVESRKSLTEARDSFPAAVREDFAAEFKDIEEALTSLNESLALTDKAEAKINRAEAQASKLDK